MKDVIVKVKAQIEEKIAMTCVAEGAKRISRACSRVRRGRASSAVRRLGPSPVRVEQRHRGIHHHLDQAGALMGERLLERGRELG